MRQAPDALRWRTGGTDRQTAHVAAYGNIEARLG